jgi:hypothetical protein
MVAVTEAAHFDVAIDGFGFGEHTCHPIGHP